MLLIKSIEARRSAAEVVSVLVCARPDDVDVQLAQRVCYRVLQGGGVIVCYGARQTIYRQAINVWQKAHFVFAGDYISVVIVYVIGAVVAIAPLASIAPSDGLQVEEEEEEEDEEGEEEEEEDEEGGGR